MDGIQQLTNSTQNLLQQQQGYLECKDTEWWNIEGGRGEWGRGRKLVYFHNVK